MLIVEAARDGDDLLVDLLNGGSWRLWAVNSTEMASSSLFIVPGEES